MLLAAVPEEQHDQVFLGRHACNSTRMLLQQYKQQWEVRQEAEKLKAVAQQILVGAIETHKQAEAAAAVAPEQTRAAAAAEETAVPASGSDAGEAAAAPAASSRQRMRR
jgi:hypothetical protein